MIDVKDKSVDITWDGHPNIFTLDEDVNEIRNCARFLGYDHNEKLSILRQKVLHDYQSLESL